MKSITKIKALLIGVVCIGSAAAIQPAQASDHDYRFQRGVESCNANFDRRDYGHEFRNQRSFNNNHPVVRSLLYRLGL